MEKISIDFIIFLTVLFTAYSGAKRGFFREFLISIAYVPYMAAMFYLVNEFIQDNISFDSILFKVSSLGGFYLAYLFVIWGSAKSFNSQLKKVGEPLILLGRFVAGLISGARTVYFCFLCLIAFNLHVNTNGANDEMIEKSKFASNLQTHALEAQSFLLSEGYINNEITLYSDAVNGTFNAMGKYEHPIVSRMKNSEKFKEMEKSIDKAKIQNQVNKYMNGNF